MNKHFEKICIIGLGYIGLPTASMFATNGLQVIGVDNNEKIVATLNEGQIHIHEPGLREIVAQSTKSGYFRATSKVEPADAFIIAVPTPFLDDRISENNLYKKADMKYVVAASEAILPHLRKGNLVILESTSPPQTTSNLMKPILERSGLKAGKDFLLAYSPERVLPGQILKELVENSRVIGGIDLASAKAGRDLYSAFVKGDIILTDSTTAEMVKLMENTYRDVNIAIANEFSRLAQRFGIDVWEAISIANLHPRVKILNPGPGVGGHCISVDPWFLVEAAPDITPLIHTARKVNDAQPEFVVQSVQHILGELKGKKITALGLSYKPDVDDFRESPAVEIVEKLLALGCEVRAYDPYATSFQKLGDHLAKSLEDAASKSDLLLLLVDHTEFKSLNPESFPSMKGKKILDTRHCVNAPLWQQAGFKVFILGSAK
jgi:UDP-N-acetyl-D-mannosaminuronic acid dehydrogenase